MFHLQEREKEGKKEEREIKSNKQGRDGERYTCRAFEGIGHL